MIKSKKLRKISALSLLMVMAMITTAICGYGPNDQVFMGDDYENSYGLTWCSPVAYGNGSQRWVQINSKWNEPRNVSGTSPHVGVDIPLAANTPICAVTGGYVYPVISPKIDDQFNTYYLESNYTPGVYVHYEHCKEITETGYVHKYEVIGKSGNEGYPGTPYHLHFGAYNSKSFDDRKSYGNATFYRNVGVYNNGRNLDTYTNVEWQDGNIPKITAVFSEKNDNHNELPLEVVFFYRLKGDVEWINGGNMTYISNFDYKYTRTSLSNTYTYGKEIEWMVRIKRDINISYPYCWAPATYYRPSLSPSSNSVGYYTNRIE